MALARYTVARARASAAVNGGGSGSSLASHAGLGGALGGVLHKQISGLLAQKSFDGQAIKTPGTRF